MAGKKTSVVLIGTGTFAKVHVYCMLAMQKDVRIAGFVDISDQAPANIAKPFEDWKIKKIPPFFKTIDEFLAANKGPADVAVIITPHNVHCEQIIACLKAGMDTLVEKPMVLNAAEARRVMKVRDETGRLFSVAFPGSYSPAVRKAKEMIAAGDIGDLKSIAVYTHQCWKQGTAGSWRQNPEISGGGFLSDTGSHAVNTMLDLAGADVAELTATQDNRGTPVDIATSLQGRFKNGVFFTLCAEGESVNCQSRVMAIGTRGVIITDQWGEFLRIIREGKWEEEPVEFPASRGTFEQFMLVRKGKIPNPCPAEVGLRFAKFIDMVRASAKK